MGRLKVLPAQVANMIAAGEVVQRPANVVKELIENAVDAGADEVNVVISDSGRTLIQVIDNGCGMSPEDAALCFERHATSKISCKEDLEGILTYGFRGEALASIAAVSEVTLRTRRPQDVTATQVSTGPSGQTAISSVSAPAGSNFAIRNLFFNTPARRKFLKSDTVEFRHIVEEFTRIAIPNPDKSFILTHNGRQILVLKKAKSLKFRILDVLGATVTGDVVDLHADTSVVKISGFVGRPESARKSVGNQYFFVDGRYFRSAYLHKAVMKAYEEMVAEGATPSYFIFLDIDPRSIDVNIHPTKTEIKFEDDNIIFQTLYACVRETLGRNSFGASIDFDTEGAVALPQLGSSFEQYRGQIQSPAQSVDADYDPFNFGASSPFAIRGEATRQDCSSLFDTAPSPAPAAPKPEMLVLQGKMIAVSVASGLMLVHVRRARERILFERALAALQTDGAHVTQTSLFPLQVQLGVERRLLFDDNADMLSRLGFDFEPSGEDSLTVNGVPEGYSCESGKVQQMVFDLALLLSDPVGALPDIMLQTTAERFARLGASGADSVGSAAQAQALVDTLFACENAEITPSGKRIISILSIEELEKHI